MSGFAALLDRLRPRRSKESRGVGFERFADVMPPNQFNAAVHYSRRFGFVYVSVPKAACSTLKLTLQRMELGDPEYQPKRVHDREESPLASPFDLGPGLVDELLADESVLTFTFVRNPYTRLLSAYLDKVARRSKSRGGRLRQLGFRADLPVRDLPFRRFVRRAVQQSDYEMDPHWRPQVRQLMLDRIRYDFVGRIESFDRDLERLDGLLEGRVRPCYTLRVRHATGARALLRQHYDKATRRLVRERYAEDFEALGYDPRFKVAVADAS